MGRFFRKLAKVFGVFAGIIAAIVLIYFLSEFVRTEQPPEGYASQPTAAISDPAYSAAITKARKIIDGKAAGFPALVVAVGAGGKIVWSEARGYADIAEKVPATRETEFRIYSTSKAITGTAAAKLIEDGKLKLDAKIGNYFPDTPVPLKDAYVWNLISHTAGIRDYYPFEWFLVSDTRCDTTDEALAFFIDDDLDFTPGTQYDYSSYEYVLLSAVMEKAAAMPFAKLLQTLIFEPAAMHATYLAPASAPDKEAVSYREGMSGGFIHAHWLDNSCKYGAGGLWSTAEDLVRFGLAVLGERIVSKAAVPRLYTSFKTTTGKTVDYGMGWGLNKTPAGRRFAGHSGGGMGGRAAIVVFPDDGVAVAITANFEGERVVEDAAAIGEIFIEHQPSNSPSQ